MNIINKYLVLLTIAVLLMSGGVASGETLQDAIKYMLQTNPNIKAESYNRLAKDQEVLQAKAGYYPSLGVTSGVSVDSYSHPASNTTYPKSTVLSLRQNLFRFFGTEYEVDRLKAAANSQAYLLQGTSETVALLASKVYIDVLRNLDLADLAKENLTNHQRISDQMKLRSVSGVDRKADLDQVMGRLALAQSNAVIAAANNIDAKTSYQAVIGRMPEDLTKPEPLVSVIPESMEESEKLALQGYPILKSAQADLDARLAQYKTAKSQLYPTIDLAVDYAWQNDVGTIVGNSENVTATASLNFNIFNGGYNKARIAQTAQQIKEAEAILNNTKRQIVQSVRLSWEAYKAAQEKVVFLEDYVKATGLTATAFAAQWNIGRSTMFDLLDTQAENITAKASLANAKYDRLYAEYRVLSSLGKLVNTLGLQWPEESRIDGATPDVPRRVEPAPQKDTVTVVAPLAAPPVSETPKQVEPAIVAPPVAPPVSETPKPVEPAIVAPPVAPPVSETPKPEEPATVAPPTSETLKQEEMKTPPAEASVPEAAAVASPLPSALTDKPKIIKGIVLMNGTVIEGQILNMNVYTVKILTKEGKEETYSFEKEVKGFIKE
jgi:adhesin transport system outer membrane protein